MNELRGVATLLFIINLVITLMVIFVIGIAPVVTRKSLLFGVRIPEVAGQSSEATRLKKNYINIMIIGGIIAVAMLIVQYLMWPDISLLAILYLPILLIIFYFVVYVSTWKQATALKRKHHWVVPVTATADTVSAVQREKIWGFPKVWYVPSVILILGLIVLSLIKYPSLPAQIPTNWGFDMQPDAWGDKSFWTVLLLPIVTLFMIVGMMAANITIYRMKLQVSVEHPELSYAQHRLYRHMMNNAVGICSLVVTIFFGLVQLMAIDIYVPSTTMMVVMTVLMILACTVPFTYVYLKAGQSGCKLKPTISEADTKATSNKMDMVAKFNRGDDKFWKMGMFYYNEDDPTMLIEDRFGMNTGFNYARTASKVVTVMLIILVVAVYIGATIMFLK